MSVAIIVLEIQHVHISEGLHVMTKNGFISHDLDNTDFLLHKYIETVELHLTFATAQSCTSETHFVALAPATTVRFTATFGELFASLGYWRIGCPEDLPFLTNLLPSPVCRVLYFWLTLGCLGPHTTSLVGSTPGVLEQSCSGG